MPRMIRSPDPESIASILSTFKPLEVNSKYQRDYDWSEPELAEFVGDINRLLTGYRSSPQDPPVHFFGGLIFVPIYGNGRTSGAKHEIVDGQQRLTTFTIALAVIRDAFREVANRANAETHYDEANEANEWAEDTNENFLYFTYMDPHTKKRESGLRLILSDADKIQFEEMIGGNEVDVQRESHERLLFAKEYIKTYLTEPILNNETLEAREIIDALVDLRECMLHNSEILHIIGEDPYSVKDIFKTLNDRGKSLGAGNLLRADTLQFLNGHDDLLDKAIDYWDDILGYSPREIEDFLDAYYISNTGKRTGKRELSDKICSQFFKFDQDDVPLDRDNAVRVFNDIQAMHTEMEVFVKLADGVWPYAGSRQAEWDRDRLRRLITFLRHKLCIPLLLSASQTCEEATFFRLVDMLERFFFRFKVVCNLHPQPMKDLYDKFAKALRDDVDTDVDDIKDELVILQNEKAHDELFNNMFSERISYSQSSTDRKRRVKHLLSTLESHHVWLANGANGDPNPERDVIYDLGQITIEHIYPQSAETPDSELESVKHSIGNLSFWNQQQNQAGSNQMPVEKRELYSNSNIRLNRELAEIETWSREDVERRQWQLQGSAARVFELKASH